MDVPRIAVVTANFGGFDNPKGPVDQSVKHDSFIFDESNFPLRDRALTPRLQARLVKCFAWQMAPGYNYYIWHDSSVQLGHKDSVKWLLGHIQNSEIALLKHPSRNTIGAEAKYLKERLAKDDSYITSRYKGELIDEQMAAINNPKLSLFATTAFIYRPTYNVKNAMKEWWYNISRYHIIDQLSIAHSLEKFSCNLETIPDNFLNTPYLTHTR